MKKIIMPFALFSSLFLATSAFAAGTFTSAGYSEDGTTTDLGTSVLSQFTTSTSVILSVSSNESQYAAATAHSQGDREYGTTSAATQIFWQDKVVGDDVTDLTNSSVTQFDDWTSL